MAHPEDIRVKARELYIENGLTFEAVADQTGVNAATLWRWAQAEGWRQKREDLRCDLDDIRVGTIKLRKELMKKVLVGLEGGKVDPMQIFAVSSLESAAAKLIKSDQATEIEAAPEREIKNAVDAVEALQEAIARKVNRLLARNDETSLSAGIKDIKAAQDLLDKLKKQYAVEDPGEQGPRIPTADEIREVRERFL